MTDVLGNRSPRAIRTPGWYHPPAALDLLTVPGHEWKTKLCRNRNVDGVRALQPQIGSELRRQVRKAFVEGYEKEVRERA